MKKYLLIALSCLSLFANAQVLQIVPNAPTVPQEGQIYYKPSDQTLNFFNGTEWRILRGEPAERFVSVPAAAFSSVNPAASVGYNNQGYAVGMTDSNTGLHAPVVIPYNKKITRVEAIVYDASATNNLSFYVLLNAGFSPGSTSIPALNSVGSGGLQTLSAIVDPPLENGGQTFFVSVGAFPRWDANLKVLEYRFTYSN